VVLAGDDELCFFTEPVVGHRFSDSVMRHGAAPTFVCVQSRH